MVPELQLRIAQELERDQPPLGERGCAPCDGLVAEVGERRASPQRERGVQVVTRRPCGAPFERGGAPGDERLEAVDVQLVLTRDDAVAVAARLDPVGAECAPQPVDVDLQRSRRRVRCLLAPQGVDQLRTPEHLAAVEQQLGEQRSLLGRADRDGLAVAEHLDRPEQPELDLARQLSLDPS